MTTAGAPAHQRLDLRKVEVDDVLTRVESTLALRLDVDGAVRKRRSIGFHSDRGTWVRVECRGLDRPLDQGWGTESASGITGVPMPAWHQGGSWLDHERGVRWRADETDLIIGSPIGNPQGAQELPSSWWEALGSTLGALGGYRTYRRATPDLEPATGNRFAAAIAEAFPDVDAKVAEWTTAHADFGAASHTFQSRLAPTFLGCLSAQTSPI